MRPLLSLLLLSFYAAAQQPTPTFSANSNLVIVDITVRDKAGKPIEGLKEDDFTVIAGSLYLIGEAMEILKLSSINPGNERNLNEWSG